MCGRSVEESEEQGSSERRFCVGEKQRHLLEGSQALARSSFWQKQYENEDVKEDASMVTAVALNTSQWMFISPKC
jgi:hypothetical protein